MKKIFITIIFLLALIITACFGNFPLNGGIIPAKATLTAQEIKDQIKAKEAEVKKLEEELLKYKKEVSGAKAQQKTLNNYIAQLNGQIKELNLEIKITNSRISGTTLNIQELNLDISEKDRIIDRLKYFMEITIQSIYENDRENQLLSFLNNNNLSDFLNQVKFTENLQNELFKNLEKFKLLKSEVENNKAELERAKIDLEKQKETLADQEKITNSQKDKKTSVLIKTKSIEAKFQSLSKEAEAKQKDMQKEIYELEEKLRYVLDPTTYPAARKGLLFMPTEGVISQGYGSVAAGSVTSDFYKFHNGIDIASGMGTIIKAAESGKIIASGEAPYAYGKWIVIDHENGLVTLYGHMSLKKASLGQRVKRGEVIGYMGSTGLSTGPHLHFTVYGANTFIEKKSAISGTLPIGASINPRDYL